MKGKRTETPHRWRENIEALTMAIAIALLFKAFILEISKIPSGSMQPTLLGNPETAIFDRVLVDKLSFRFRDPDRFEVVVFKHPLERSRVMVKRIVGLPGEELRIERGDLWIRHGPEEPWSILRRPERVQRAMWKDLDRTADRFSWSVIAGGRDWRISGRDVLARGDGTIRYRDGQGPVRDGYADGYPEALSHEGRRRDPGENAVGDLRLEGGIRAVGGTERVTIELTEGKRRYEFELPGPAADSALAPTIRIEDPEAGNGSMEIGAPEAWRLPAGKRVSFAAENLDDRLALLIDGDEVVAAEVPPSARQDAFLTVAITGEGAELEDLHVLRDIYYLPQKNGEFSIPAEHYVVLGDNTQDSADSRDWRSFTFSWEEDGVPREERGNYRPGAKVEDAPNPVYAQVDGASWTRFRDRWGENNWFDEEKVVFRGTPEPLVPRTLIQGRAVATFWPLKPWRRLWRLGWVH